jgi:hypothetical protein
MSVQVRSTSVSRPGNDEFVFHSGQIVLDNFDWNKKVPSGTTTSLG